jgi:ornithine decarboxylase
MTTRNQHINKNRISSLKYHTPYFLFDKEAIVKNVTKYKENLPLETEICYAMKANSEKEVLKTLKNLGSSFEVASIYELALLKDMQVDPEHILCGTAVKPADAIREFYRYGVRRFAVDSRQELEKIAQNAPGSKVYARVLVNDEAESVFTMSEKFGSPKLEASEILTLAASLGLEAYGISFNVGSQARNAEAWANALHDLHPSLIRLANKGIKLEVINLGGGFPFAYKPNDGIPSIEEISRFIKSATSSLPYPIKFIAEPGRALVADAFALVTSVFAKNKRPNGHWLYLDAGAYNALLEVMPYQGSIEYQIDLVRPSKAPLEPYILTGPTGDSLDVVGKRVLLPQDVTVDDKLLIHDTGAYSFTLMTPFNGFPKPPTHTIDP